MAESPESSRKGNGEGKRELKESRMPLWTIQGTKRDVSGIELVDGKEWGRSGDSRLTRNVGE